MMRSWRAFWTLGVVGLLAISAFPMGLASAGVGSCSATIAPASVQPAATVVFDVTVHNTTGPEVRWIQIQRPNDDYRVDAAGLDGWDAAIDESGMVLTNGSLPTGGDFAFQLATRTNLDQSPPTNWTVRVSDDSGGLAATVCTGSVATEITGHFPGEAAGQRVSDVTVDATFTAATVRWYSDVPTGSEVLYGKTADYGSTTPYDATFTTTHKVTVPGLSAATGYHFQVAGIDESGNPSYSGDNTFSTAAVPVVTVGGSDTATGSTVARSAAAPRGTVAIKATPTEVIPPTVALTTNLTKPLTTNLTVAGVAHDNEAVARIDYSLDGGKSWVLVPSPPGLGAKQASFSFNLAGTEDGNYVLVVRATDTSGNIGTSGGAAIVVDHAPPQLGSELLSFGPQVTAPDANGLRTVVGAEQTLTVNAVGGPTRIVVVATRSGARRASQNFMLQRNVDSGLWTGILAFDTAGSYHLAAMAVDGAGNQTSRSLGEVTVMPAARVVEAGGDKPVAGATVTLYSRRPDSTEWRPWDAASYDQVNPQRVRSDGSFALLVPAGIYYLKATAPGYESLITRQFTTDRPMPLAPTLRLAAQPKLRLGRWTVPLPWLSLSQADIQPAGQANAVAADLIGQRLPAFRLPTTHGDTVTAVSLQGKPALVTVLSTWAPSTAEQLPALAALAARSDLNVRPLYIAEHSGKVQTALARAGYNLTALVDTNATLGTGLGVPNVPTHYVLDRDGTVMAVRTGVLSADRLLSLLTGL